MDPDQLASDVFVLYNYFIYICILCILKAAGSIFIHHFLILYGP